MLFMVGVLWDMLLGRIQEARRSDRGASALEWALIAAVSVAMAVLIGGIVYHLVSTQSNNVKKCTNVAPGGNC